MIKQTHLSKTIQQTFVQAFMNDSLYINIEKDNDKRLHFLNNYLPNYMKMILPTCSLFSFDDKAFALIYDPLKAPSKMKATSQYYLSLILSYKNYIHYGFKWYHQLVRELLEGSDWLDDYENYYHIDLLAVTPHDQGQGYGSRLMRDLIELAQIDGKVLTLETQNSNHVSWYQSFGFELLETEVHKGYSQYNMILSHKNK